MTDAQSAQTALDKLIEAVEASDLNRLSAHNVKQAIGIHGFAYLHSIVHHGSLDAALALHEALLPGWEYVWQYGGGTRPSANVYKDSYTDGFKSHATTPARAWLLAILRAYRSMQQ